MFRFAKTKLLDDLAQKRAIHLTHGKHGTNFPPSPKMDWSKDRKDRTAPKTAAECSYSTRRL